MIAKFLVSPISKLFNGMPPLGFCLRLTRRVLKYSRSSSIVTFIGMLATINTFVLNSKFAHFSFKCSGIFLLSQTLLSLIFFFGSSEGIEEDRLEEDVGLSFLWFFFLISPLIHIYHYII